MAPPNLRTQSSGPGLTHHRRKHSTVTDAAALREDLRSYLVVFEGAEPVARHIVGPEPLTG